MGKIIAVDFDGTLCENKYPDIGVPNQELIDYIKERQNNGDQIILWTCRREKALMEAVAWCMDQGLRFDAINRNVSDMIEYFGDDTRKVFANEYIDDRNADRSKYNIPFKKGE